MRNECPACGETKTAVFDGLLCYACGLSGAADKLVTPCRRFGMEKSRIALGHRWNLMQSGNESEIGILEGKQL